jgi:hypothetical protein
LTILVCPAIVPVTIEPYVSVGVRGMLVELATDIVNIHYRIKINISMILNT